MNITDNIITDLPNNTSIISSLITSTTNIISQPTNDNDNPSDPTSNNSWPIIFAITIGSSIGFIGLITLGIVIGNKIINRRRRAQELEMGYKNQWLPSTV